MLSVIALAGVLGVTGCSCTKAGEYDFNSIVMTVGEEEKTYSCTKEEKEGNALLNTACSIYEKATLELNKDGELITKFDGEENSKVWYKLEDGKLMVKANENGNYEESGKYKSVKLTLSVNFGSSIFKVIFKK